MGVLRDIAQEGGEKIIFYIVIVFLLSLVGIRLLWGLFKAFFSIFGISLPVISLSGTFTMFILIAVALLAFSFSIGDIREKGIVGLLILIGAIIVLLIVGFYAPQWYPDAFSASMLDIKTATQSIVPLP